MKVRAWGGTFYTYTFLQLTVCFTLNTARNPNFLHTLCRTNTPLRSAQMCLYQSEAISLASHSPQVVSMVSHQDVPANVSSYFPSERTFSRSQALHI